VGIGRHRAVVVLLDGRRIAVIEREHDGAGRWYPLPGGGVEPGETVDQAAIREAREELGLDVALGPIVATARRARPDGSVHVQTYFSATATGGVFGSGEGVELTRDSSSASGSYRPMWIDLDDVDRLDVRPRSLLDAIRARGIEALCSSPIEVLD